MAEETKKKYAWIWWTLLALVPGIGLLIYWLWKKTQPATTAANGGSAGADLQAEDGQLATQAPNNAVSGASLSGGGGGGPISDNPSIYAALIAAEKAREAAIHPGPSLVGTGGQAVAVGNTKGALLHNTGIKPKVTLH